MGEETRQAFYIEDVKDISLRQVKAQPVENAPTFVLRNVSQMSIKDCQELKDQQLQTVATKKF